MGQLISSQLARMPLQRPVHAGCTAAARDAVGQRAAQGSRAATAPRLLGSEWRYGIILAYELPYTVAQHGQHGLRGVAGRTA